MRVVSRWCRCIVQRLCATDSKRPCLVRAAAPHSAPARTPGVYAQMLCTMQSQLSIHSPSPRGRGQSVEKPLSLSKNGVWGVAPRQVAGTPVPVFSPFPGERGQGDRDSKLEVCFKNRLFLQAVTAVFCGCFFSPHYLKSRQKNAIIVKVYRQTLMSVGWK